MKCDSKVSSGIHFTFAQYLLHVPTVFHNLSIIRRRAPPLQTDQISFNFMGFSKEKIVKNIELAPLSPVGVYTPLVENIGCTPVFGGSHSPIG